MLRFFFFFKQKTAYEITYGDWSSDVCSSDLHRAAGHLFDILAEVADREFFRDRHLAFVRRVFADDQPEQRRLAGAVGADEADPLVRIELKGGVDEQDLPAVLLVDARESNHVGLSKRPYAPGPDLVPH